MLLTIGCGAAPRQLQVSPTRNALPCAGRSLEDTVSIPELGPLPSGEAVTAGMSLHCTDDVVEVLDWGPDSSSSYVVPRARAMELWEAFGAPATHDERLLRALWIITRDER